MAKTIRIHNLAKELGVPSKVIIEKCNAEGVQPPIKNHMTAVKLGLAESIREWFNEDDDVTTVEVADRVDLESVKVQRKPEPEKEPAPEQPDSEQPREDAAAAEQAATPTDAPPPAETAQAPTPPETLEPAADAQAAPKAEPVVETPEPVAEGEAGETVPPQPLEPAAAEQVESETELPVTEEAQPTPAIAEHTHADEPHAPEQEREQRPAAREEQTEKPAPPPEPVRPAGPQVVPQPAELKGPRVVRIEKPDPVRPPRPARPRPAAQMPEVVTDAPARGKRGKRPGDDRPFRSRSPRRHTAGEESIERIKEWRDQDILERKERLASATGHGVRARRSADRGGKRSPSGPVTAERKAPVEIEAPLTAKQFCATVGVPFNQIFPLLMQHAGRPFTLNQTLDAELVEFLIMELDLSNVVLKRARTALETLEDEVKQRDRNNLQSRPPVVGVLGHVDHGKTSLLDRIRSAKVASGEAGGITQHIAAYRVTSEGWDVTFLDTPGHEAFTAMRARGANLTDVVVLVIAADDGVMPQTIEAMNHAKAAGVQIVVALNKIDLPGVDLNRIYAQLAEHELTPTEWGGDTDVVKTSATTGEGVDELLAHLSTLSELLELQADPAAPAVGQVIEAQLREGRGVAATILVLEGTLKVGQTVVCGGGYGRVRSLINDQGKRIKEAGPGTPVEVVGLDELPESGDKLYVVKHQNEAKTIAEEVRQQRRQKQLQQIRKPTTLEELLKSESDSEVPELNLILKADVQGSVDVLTESLKQFPSEKARLRVLHAGVGVISEADIELARASKALCIGFHVVADDRARSLAEQYGVQIRLYRVIYEIHDDVVKALEGLLAPDEQEEYRGRVEVREVYNISRIGTIAGCYVNDGIVNRNHRVRLIRDGRVITENHTIDSLKRFKDDAKEVRAGLECGLKIAGYNDIKPGDVIEAYEIVEVAQKL